MSDAKYFTMAEKIISAMDDDSLTDEGFNQWVREQEKDYAERERRAVDKMATWLAKSRQGGTLPGEFDDTMKAALIEVPDQYAREMLDYIVRADFEGLGLFVYDAITTELMRRKAI